MGNVSEFIDGINVYGQSVYICTDPEIYTDDTDTITHILTLNFRPQAGSKDWDLARLPVGVYSKC